MPNRGPVTLSIDEVDRILDLLPAPEAGEDKEITSIRTKSDMLSCGLEKRVASLRGDADSLADGTSRFCCAAAGSAAGDFGRSDTSELRYYRCDASALSAPFVFRVFLARLGIVKGGVGALCLSLIRQV
eukprot:1666205-Pyramimonas_sp.AAC.3